jgi:DNA-binding GntR family transcriptional regulator
MMAARTDVRRATKRQSYADTVYDLLRRDILRGTIEAGERLREDELSQRYRVSRTPIREALNKLEAEGLIASSAGRGMIVAEFDEDEILEGYAIRGALEGVAARLAAQRATDVDLARLELLLDALGNAATGNDMSAIVRVSGEFHAHIWRIAGNRRLLKIMREIEDSIGRLQRLTQLSPGRMEHAMKEHRAMVAAIRRRDPALAEQLARDHMREAQLARISLSVKQRVEGEASDESSQGRAPARRGRKAIASAG